MSARRELAVDGAKLIVFLIVTAFSVAFLVVVTGNLHPGEKRGYHAVFTDVSGLKVGDEVRVASVASGRVTSLAFIKGNKVRVAFSLDRSTRPTEASTATVRYKNITGDRYLAIERGRVGAAALKFGASIPTSRTTSALDLDTLLDGFKPLFVGLNPGQINQLSDQLVQVLQGQSSAVYTLVSTIASFSSTIASRDALVGQVIRNVNDVLGVLDKREESVGTIVDQLTLLVTELDKKAPGVLDATARIDRLAVDAADLVRKARDTTTPNLRSLRAVAASLNENSTSLQTTLTQWPQHYRTVGRTASFGNFLNFYLCGVRLRFSPEGARDPVMTPWLNSEAARCKP
jgi:phospholipid/cholesterol/gamma-HCH transport system substrate-binding protein